MSSMRDTKQRISSVKSTQQITKAMNLVSTSKLQRAKARLDATRPFFNETQSVIANIINNSKGIKHKYIIERQVKNSAIIVINGDLGLCGGYNTNVAAKSAALIRSKQNPVSVITVGSKSKDYFKRRGANVVQSYVQISEKPFYDDAAVIGKYVLGLYNGGEIDEVFLAYTEFKSTLSHEPKVIKLLPVDTSAFSQNEKNRTISLMEYEPNEEAVLNVVVPKYINTVIYGALVESAACEQGARMTAMDSATENAYEMIDSLTLIYNRARQGAITQEISEIVGGANALE